ncbi:MAG: DNA polymerase I [Clostridiales bacterium]|nr:DNA polymerase I [Clostridiales bacterium]
MKLLVIDGNSIVNRAFYGIKLLTTKDGRFTNGIYGFMNILLKLRDENSPDAVVAAFDLKAPTFRHKMYDGYKAGRKGMPDELAQQMPVLKELLSALGYKIIEKEGFEADDILGTLSSLCRREGAECVIATGDRDSLQLVSDDTSVLLASTKMGRPQTVRYTPEKILEEYGITPRQLIDIKALMGDSSDNIPGVSGIGQKTASDLIQRFSSVDNIYENIDTIDVKQGVRDKLKADKDMAYLSRTLGTICTDAPLDIKLSDCLTSGPDIVKVTRILTSLEMFGMLEKLNLKPLPVAERPQTTEKVIEETSDLSPDEVYELLKKSGKAYFTADYEGGYISEIRFFDGDRVITLSCGNLSFPAFMKKFLEDGEIIKFTSDIKPLFAYAYRNNIEPAAIGTDTMLAGYVLNPSSGNYDILRLAGEYGVYVPDVKDEKISSTAVLPELSAALEKNIVENGQKELLHEIEIPLSKVLASMETVGFEVDSDGIERFGIELDSKISELTEKIYEAAGFEFNLNSPKQLADALFEKMKLPSAKKTKSGYSTKADILENLADDHPIVADILEYRTLAKLKSTYCDGLLKVISPDGRIHSTLNQTETRTGRISSTEPNLQNIPVRSETGREMRKFFRAKEGCLLVDADYSQIELRVLAHMANDSVMIDAFNNNDDIHAITASQVFNMPLQMVTPLMRSRAKAVNFGIVYGIGAFSLAKNIGVSRAEADRYIKEYLHHYSGVDRYMHEVVNKAKENGYAETLFKRRRYLPELSSSNGNLRAFGERVARNMPIQGTAADIIKIAMINVCEKMKKANMKSRLILQIHDELIVEAPENEVAEVTRLLGEEMENAAKMSVKLSADVHSGKTWYDAKG